MLIDSHVHLADEKFSRDLTRVLERGRDAGVERFICIADDIAASRDAVALARRYPDVSATAGFHPQHESRYQKQIIDELRALAKAPEVVAIGEAGLDYHYPGFDKKRQTEILLAQAQVASEMNLPMVLHCRDAYGDLIELFKNEKSVTSRGVVHCFCGEYEEARALLDLEFYLGIGGAMTYPNASGLRETIRRIGIKRLVIETDAPYLPPQGKRGRRNEPSYLKFTIKELADTVGTNYQEAARITTSNSRDLYKLKPLNRTAAEHSDRAYFIQLESTVVLKKLCDSLPPAHQYEEFVLSLPEHPMKNLEPILAISSELKKRGCRVRLAVDDSKNQNLPMEGAAKFVGLLDAVTIEFRSANGDAPSPGIVDFTREIKKYVPEICIEIDPQTTVDIDAARKLAEDDLKVRFRISEKATSHPAGRV